VNVWLVGLLVLTPIVAVVAITRNERRVATARAATTELRVDEFGCRRLLADGREEGVDWVEITEVEVLTAKTGPHASAGGVVILSGDEEHGCLVPIDRLQDSGVAEQLTRLPGFDSQRLVRALSEKPPKRTVCWQRTPDQTK
jgi:hypothetical protein